MGQIQSSRVRVQIPEYRFWKNNGNHLIFAKPSKNVLSSNFWFDIRSASSLPCRMGAFTNYVYKILASFDHLPPCVYIFYGMKVYKKFTFLDHLPTLSCKRSLWTPPKRFLLTRFNNLRNIPKAMNIIRTYSISLVSDTLPFNTLF